MIRIFLHLSFLFIFGSILGWILELFFRRIVHKKWVNPGFLKGPYLPIYGIGIVILYIVASVELPIDSKVATYILKTLAIGFLMTAVEYVGGIIFIKKIIPVYTFIYRMSMKKFVNQSILKIPATKKAGDTLPP